MPNQYFTPPASSEKITKPQSGSLCEVYFLPVEYFTNYDFGKGLLLPKPSTNIVESDLLTGGFTWLKANTTRTKDYAEEEKEAEAGSFFEVNISCYFAFEDQKNHLNFSSFQGRKFIVLVKALSGLTKIIGSYENPCTIQQAYNSGNLPSAQSGTNLRFNWKSPSKPLLYTGAITASGGGSTGGGSGS